MAESSDHPLPVGAVVSGPHWPNRVRVVRVEPHGSSRVLIEAVTPDGQSRLIYDLPWTPTRLEQRMGRIHRYGQWYEVTVYNLVATTTREGMVLHALLNKLERMRQGLGQDRVFDVVDQLLEGAPLERLIRDALANRLTFEEVRDQALARLLDDLVWCPKVEQWVNQQDRRGVYLTPRRGGDVP